MSKGLPRSLSHGSPMAAPVKKLTIAINALALTSNNASSGDGWATAVIRGLPEGNILILGAVSNLQFTHGADSNATATFTGAFAIGTAATADATLTGSDVDVIPSTALAAATGGVSPVTRGAQPAQAIVDNTAKTLSINLNVKIDDATISGVAAFTASGFLSLAYIVLGDD